MSCDWLVTSDLYVYVYVYNDKVDPPGPEYYQSLRRRLGNSLTEEQYAAVERMGLLADRDEGDGVLLQIFTKPVGDRATLFLEVIQVSTPCCILHYIYRCIE